MRSRWFAIMSSSWLLVCATPYRTPDEAADPSWLTKAQEEIAAREYRASANSEGLQAPNRSHNLRTYFDRTGIRVHDRTAGGSPELLRLSLRGVGRGEAFATAAPGEQVVAHENRVEIHRPGVVEWYVNSPAGLEQGFTLAERPAGEGALVIELAVAGAKPSLRGEVVLFETGAQRKLRYGELVANDADADVLAAHLEVASVDRLRIVVDDTGATYPIVIDPILTETADTQLEGEQLTARLGNSVASAGDVNGDGYADVIVGSSIYDAGLTDEGAAFVFLGSASGIADGNPTSAGVAQLESDQQASLFGWSVAGAGDVDGDGYADVLVGAHSYTSGESGEGAAFVFLGSATGIPDGSPATAAAQLESNQASARFGFSAAGAGDVNGDGYADVIVGADFYDAPDSAEGAAFVFLGSASGIADSNPATLSVTQLESDQANALLGTSVAGAGDVNGDGYSDVIVGAENYDAGVDNEGAAFVFLGSASGIADGNPVSAATQLESNQTNGLLGSSLAGAGDVNGDGYADVIVGSRLYDAGQSNEGAAFVFLGSGSGVADGDPVSAAAQLESNQGSSAFGFSVSGAGDTNGDGYADVLVGAYQYDAGQTDEGAAFLFLGSATGVADGNPLTATAQLESNQMSARAGYAVAGADVNGDGYGDVIVSAYFYDNGIGDEGAVFVYHGGAAGIADGNPSTAAAQLEANQLDSNFGAAVAAAGDVNGDGYGDVIVGASRFDAGQINEGAAFVFLGSASGIANADPTGAWAQLESNQGSALLGTSVAGAGDVNGDGYGDVIVGATMYDAGQSNEGAAFVYHGGSIGIVLATVIEANVASGFYASFAHAVAGAGDVNGDGYGDVLVGAWAFDVGLGGNNDGAAFVFHGSASGIVGTSPAAAAAQIESDQVGAQLAFDVAGAGDVNGDGYADVIVGANGYDAGQSNEGAAFVYHGSSSGIADGDPSTAAAQLESNLIDGALGNVAAAGDVDGDGYGDVIVGAEFYTAGQQNEGAAFVFHGSASGIGDGNPATAEAALQSNEIEARLGGSVAGAGDVNGDGYADVIIGAGLYDAGQVNEGAAFVFLGSASGIAGGTLATAAAQLESDEDHSSGGVSGFGESVAGAGDVDGDGLADVIVGARAFDTGSFDGAAFVFPGSSAGGRPVLARQRRGDGSGIAVQPWGQSKSATGFAAELRASHPDGTGRVRAEVEACPPGVAFGDVSCSTQLSPAWVDVDGATPDVLLSHTLTSLTNSTLYRWHARVLHAASTGAVPAEPAHGPWRRVDAQSVEADVRMPEPGLLLSLACGAALVTALALRRATGRSRTARVSAQTKLSS